MSDIEGAWLDSRPANRPAFGGTVPLFYHMSRVPLYHGNVPLFVRSRIFFWRARAICSVRFLAKIPNGTVAESPCYSVFWNAIDSVGCILLKKNLNVGPANRPAFCRQVPLFFTRNVPLKTFSRLAGLLMKCVIHGKVSGMRSR